MYFRKAGISFLEADMEDHRIDCTKCKKKNLDEAHFYGDYVDFCLIKPRILKEEHPGIYCKECFIKIENSLKRKINEN